MVENNRIRLKVCGMRDSQNILDIAHLNPSYLGFIFYRDSKRAVGKDFKIPTGVPSNIGRVGVFVGETSQEILRLSALHRLEYAQLHGDETPEQCEELRSRGMRVIKVFHVDEKFRFETTEVFRRNVDFLLFETKSNVRGGSGQTFDWNILTRYNQEVPFFLSGGIAPENAEQLSVLKGMNLHALDVNSRVEMEPGLKEPTKVKQMQEALNKINMNL